jgi:hypothetical protein
MAWTLGPVLVAAAGLAFACREDPGLDIVRVPAQAYLAVDATPPVQTVADAGSDGPVFMLCIEAPSAGKPSDDDDEDAQAEVKGPDMSTDFEDCPRRYEDRPLDPRITQRHREKGEESACCYRAKGSHPQPVRQGRGE